MNHLLNDTDSIYIQLKAEFKPDLSHYHNGRKNDTRAYDKRLQPEPSD